MACSHLRELYHLCQQHDLKLSSSDLIHIVCQQCQEEEVCPSTLAAQYDAHHAAEVDALTDVDRHEGASPSK